MLHDTENNEKQVARGPKVDIQLRGGANNHESLARMLERIAADVRAQKYPVDSRIETSEYTFGYDLSEYEADEE